MKKYLLVMISLFSLSFAGTPFTVTEIDELYVVLVNDTKLLNEKTEKILKTDDA